MVAPYLIHRGRVSVRLMDTVGLASQFALCVCVRVWVSCLYLQVLALQAALCHQWDKCHIPWWVHGCWGSKLKLTGSACLPSASVKGVYHQAWFYANSVLIRLIDRLQSKLGLPRTHRYLTTSASRIKCIGHRVCFVCVCVGACVFLVVFF